MNKRISADMTEMTSDEKRARGRLSLRVSGYGRTCTGGTWSGLRGEMYVLAKG